MNVVPFISLHEAKSTHAWLTDSHGHAAVLPRILTIPGQPRARWEYLGVVTGNNKSNREGDEKGYRQSVKEYESVT